MKRERMFHAPPWGAGVLIHPATAREYDDSNLRITKNRQFVCLLEQSHPPLGEGNLSVCWILNLLQLYFSTPHWYSLVLLLSYSTHQRTCAANHKGFRIPKLNHDKTNRGFICMRGDKSKGLRNTKIMRDNKRFSLSNAAMQDRIETWKVIHTGTNDSRNVQCSAYISRFYELA